MLAELKQFKNTARPAEGLAVDKGKAIFFMAREAPAGEVYLNSVNFKRKMFYLEK